MNRFLLILLFTLTGLVSNAQDGQYKVLGGEKSFLSPQKYTIASCSVTGVDYLDVNAIRLISGLTIGKEISVPGQDISTAINSLWEQELFSDVQIFALKTVGDEIFLQIDLKGRPKLNGFNFFDEDGELIRKGEADKLREEINLQSGNTITESLVKNTENIVRGYYAEKGFYKASVNIVQVYDTTAFNARKFNINIDKGQRIKIKEINIEEIGRAHV